MRSVWHGDAGQSRAGRCSWGGLWGGGREKGCFTETRQARRVFEGGDSPRPAVRKVAGGRGGLVSMKPEGGETQEGGGKAVRRGMWALGWRG